MPYLPAGFRPLPPQPLVHRIKCPEDNMVVYESGEAVRPESPLKGRHSPEIVRRAQEVYALHKAGKQRAQIAELLGISPTTVSKLKKICLEVRAC